MYKCNKCEQLFKYYDNYETGGKYIMGYCPACGAFQKKIPKENLKQKFIKALKNNKIKKAFRIRKKIEKKEIKQLIQKE